MVSHPSDDDEEVDSSLTDETTDDLADLFGSPDESDSLADSIDSWDDMDPSAPDENVSERFWEIQGQVEAMAAEVITTVVIYDEKRVEVEYTTDMTATIYERIGDAIEKREKQGYDIRKLVLGQPQYDAVTNHTRDKYGDDPEDALPIDEIIVVPGPCIHPVISNNRMLKEYQMEEYVDDED